MRNRMGVASLAVFLCCRAGVAGAGDPVEIDSLVALAEYAAEHEDDQAWEAEESAEGAFEHVSMGAEALAEYLEYLHHYLKDVEA